MHPEPGQARGVKRTTQRSLLVVIVVSMLATPLRAEPQANANHRSDLGARLDFLTQRLNAQRHHADHWRRGWTAIFLASAATNGFRAVDAGDPATRGAFGVETVKSCAGLIDHVLLQPSSARGGADELDAVVGSSADLLHVKVRAAERLLERNAREADTRYAWYRHAGAVLANLAGVLVVGLVWDDWTTALVNGGVGLVAGEAEIWSQPWRARDDWDNYRARFPD
jgi:hypothetical protein